MSILMNRLKLKKKIIGFIITTLFCTLVISNALGQKQIIPDVVAVENGLLQNYTKAILQDNEGFIWLGNTLGLSRYDGRNFKHFLGNNVVQKGINLNNILSLNHKGDIILAASTNGLIAYHKQLDRFFNIPLTQFLANQKPYLVDIIQDDLGNFWITDLSTSSIFKLILTGDFKYQNSTSDLDSNSYSLQQVITNKQAILDRIAYFKGNIYYITKSNNVDSKCQYIINSLDIATLESKKAYNSLCPDVENSNWFDASDNLLFFTARESKQFVVFYKNKWKTIQTDFNISSITYLEAFDKILFDAVNNQKSYIINANQLDNDFISSKNATTELLNIKVGHNEIITDKSGVIWIATSGYGLYRVTPREINIETLFHGKSIYAKPLFYNDRDAYFYNPTTDEYLFITNSRKKPKTIQNFVNNYRHTFVVKDDKERLYGLIYDGKEQKISI